MSSSSVDGDIEVDTDFENNDHMDILDSTHPDTTWWSKLISSTYSGNEDYWRNLLDRDESQFRIRFQESFLEKCKHFLGQIAFFVDHDTTWSSIMRSKVQMQDNSDDESISDDESLSMSIDSRRYKLFKMIDWDVVVDNLRGDSDDQDDDGNSDVNEDSEELLEEMNEG